MSVQLRGFATFVTHLANQHRPRASIMQQLETDPTSPSSPTPYSLNDSDGWSETIDRPSTAATSVTDSPIYRHKPDPFISPSLPSAPISDSEDEDDRICCSQCSTPIPPEKTTKTLPCGHTTCRACIRRAVSLSLAVAAQGAEFTPARCCSGERTLPLALVGSATHLDVFLAYRERLIERKTPPEARLYCHAEECGMFIATGTFSSLRRGRTAGSCPRCRRKTCVRCGRRAHMAGCKPGREFRPRPGKVVDWLARVE